MPRGIAKPQARKGARPAPAPRGRPKGAGLKLTPELERSIVDDLTLAMPFEAACGRAGIAVSTANEWRRRGEAGEAPYSDFLVAVTRARCEAVRLLTVRALAGGKGSSNATWFLERRYPKDYGSVQRLEHSGPDGKPISIEAKALAEMTDDELLRLAEGK